MIYIMGRGFFIAAITGMLAGVASLLPPGEPVTTGAGDLMMARAFSA